MDKNKALEKIQKLLRLSNSPNEGEAMNAVAAAQRLMAEFHISQDEVSLEDKSSVIEEAITEKTKTVSNKRAIMAAHVAAHFRCRCFVRGNRIKLIGEEVDVKICRKTFEFAWLAYEKLFKKWAGASEDYEYADRSGRLLLRNSYFEGFVKGLVEAFSQNESNKEYALALIIPNSVMEHVSENYPNLRTKRFSSRRSAEGDAGSEAYVSGKADGILTGSQV